MRRFVSFGPALIVLLTTALMLFAAPAVVKRVGYAQTSARVTLARHALQEDDILLRINEAVRNVARSVEPSVVHIDVRRRGTGSTGSGWIYDSQGHVVTNAHVVAGAIGFRVQLSDGRLINATLVGADDYTDVALLRLNERDGIVPAIRATGEPPEQGDRVFAFGSPFGFKFSMSEGIVSGLGRSPRTAMDIGGYTNFIQTDAAVNPGNSGGPLVDVQGRVIGMNVAIATGSNSEGTVEGQSAGISFAIPLATIESVVEQLTSGGKVARGYLGINYNSGQVARVESGGEFKAVGIRVTGVAEDGPAARAGLRTNDILVAIDGQRLHTSEVLRSIVAAGRPGRQLQIEAYRDGTPLTLHVVLGEFPREQLVHQLLLSYGLGLAETRRGIEVVAPQRWEPAFTAGFRGGQVITHVQGAEVTSLTDAWRKMADAGFLEGRRVDVTVRNSGDEVSQVLQIDLRR